MLAERSVLLRRLEERVGAQVRGMVPGCECCQGHMEKFVSDQITERTDVMVLCVRIAAHGCQSQLQRKLDDMHQEAARRKAAFSECPQRSPVRRVR